MSRPLVSVLATGGTIASHFDGREWLNLSGSELLGRVDGLGDVATIEVHDVETGPSSNLTISDMLAIVGRVDVELRSGAHGVVVTHGTDTIEITSFLAHLLLADANPVVFTGSMRPNSHSEPDGPANITDSVTIAADLGVPGVSLCLNGRIHDPRLVRKVDASGLDAFFSFPDGPIGTVKNGEVVVDRLLPRQKTLSIPRQLEDAVSLIAVYPGMSEHELRRSVADARGVVVEGFGDLNLPLQLWGPIHEWSTEGRLVVVTSGARTPTVDNDLLSLLGVVGVGWVTPQKARVATMLALSDGRSVAQAKTILNEWGRQI